MADSSYPLEGLLDVTKFSRAEIRPELFDTLIQQKGFRIKWEKAMFCSCYGNEGQPNYNCPVCKGSGYVYFDAKEIRAFVASISGRREQDRVGLQEVGTAYLTPMSSQDVGFRDRFTFIDFTTKFSQVLTRGGLGSVDKTRYIIKEVTCLRVLDQIYKPNVDFRIADDRSGIVWLRNLILEGDKYSVLYSTHPVYIAMGPIHEIRGTYSMYKGEGVEYFVELPKQFQIKREDFIDD